jgi:bifunctional ADP-heptose synthase (sugar kinase/adenylyltransferase)
MFLLIGVYDIAASLVQSWNQQRQEAGNQVLELQRLAPEVSSFETTSGETRQQPTVEIHQENASSEQPNRFRHVAVGGTFDHLHAGHKVLLTIAAWITDDRIFCGVTGEYC